MKSGCGGNKYVAFWYGLSIQVVCIECVLSERKYISLDEGNIYKGSTRILTVYLVYWEEVSLVEIWI